MKGARAWSALALGACLVLPAVGAGQTADALSRRIDAADGARVAFHFAVDSEVTVCENGFRRGSDGGTWWGRWDDDEAVCPGGPLEIVLLRRDGGIREVDFGPVGSRPRDVDLGEVDPGVAADFLVSLHRRGADDDTAEDALVGAVVARDARPAPGLLALARDRAVSNDLRRGALFWVSQVAARGIDESLVGIAGAQAEDQDVRDAAVFALSQRPPAEAVPSLMELARSAPHVETRRSALFWLSQADDERIPDFFAELILRPGG